MGKGCCITGCENRNDVEKHLHFYSIPRKNTPFEQKRRRDSFENTLGVLIKYDVISSHVIFGSSDTFPDQLSKPSGSGTLSEEAFRQYLFTNI